MTSVALPDIGLVGTGPVARGIARAHVRAGGEVSAWISRDPERARRAADACHAGPVATSVDGASPAAWIVAVPDRVIPEVGERLLWSERPHASVVVLHTSGARAGADLFRAPEMARVAGSLHPLQTLSGGREGFDDADDLADALDGAHWFHEGAGRHVAERLVDAWHGRFHALAPGAKVLYHAAAAILSNHTVALHAMARDLFARAGIDGEEAAEPLQVLLEGTTANLRRLGQPDALTGPVARGDAPTVRAHLAALAEHAPQMLPAYREMARIALAIARERGLGGERADDVAAALDGG